MHLRQYLARRGAPSVTALRMKMVELGSDIKADAQIRQWIARDERGHYKRFPSPANARCIEEATAGKVSRKDMRPHDYALIWPEWAKEQAEEAAKAD